MTIQPRLRLTDLQSKEADPVMLNLFRKHATSWLIKVALFLIVIVFVFWGGYSYTSKDATRMARVNDQYITVSEYEQSYNQLLEMYRRQFGGAFSEDMIRQLNLRQQALRMLIDRQVVREAANSLGLTASAQEVQQQILQYPAFQKDGMFDRERYVLVLRQNRLSPEMFEQQLWEDLSVQNVEKFIKRQATVTDKEILSEFHFSQSPIQISYAEIDPKSYVERVVASETELKSYYEAHKEAYKEPEKRKFSMVSFNTDSFLKDVQTSDEEVKEYYSENQTTYHKQAEVKASHILFSVTEGAAEEEVAQVKAEAQNVLQQARKKEADFAELAKKHSKCPSAPQGGDLGYFTRDQMVPAFSEAAFALKPGEVSDIVQTQFGLHIIKVEDVRPERTIPLEEAKEQIELILKREKARDIVYNKARDFSDLAYAENDLRKAAQSSNLVVTESKDWLTQATPPQEITASPEAMNALFSIPEKGISSVVETSDGFLIAQVDGIKAPEIPPYEQVKARVEQDYKGEEAKKLAQKAAADLLADAGKMNSLEQVGKERKVEVKKSDWFSRSEPDKSLRIRGDALNSMFQLEEAEPFPKTPIDVNGQFFVVYQLVGKKSPAEEKLEKERAGILQKLQTQKGNQLWQAWMEEERGKSEIEIIQQL
jgi:peptidyl-prolyl cis-trans isomerase D